MLKGKTALITGSTSGIGLGIAEAFARAGATIVLNGFGDPEEIELQRAAKCPPPAIRRRISRNSPASFDTRHQTSDSQPRRLASDRDGEVDPEPARKGDPNKNGYKRGASARPDPPDPRGLQGAPRAPRGKGNACIRRPLAQRTLWSNRFHGPGAWQTAWRRGPHRCQNEQGDRTGFFRPCSLGISFVSHRATSAKTP